jgi:hypothetical protein
LTRDWPEPTRSDHQHFCESEGWRPVRDARGRTGTHHITYELDLPDGRIFRTRVSHPPDRSTYGRSLWAHILRDQLHVTDEEFWACVRDGVRPNRGVPSVPAEALPAEIVHLLINRVGLTEADVAAMSKDEAVSRLNEFWTHGTP